MQTGEIEQAVAFATVRREIAERVRRVCAGFDARDFDALVDRMASIAVRYRMRDDWELPTREDEGGH